MNDLSTEFTRFRSNLEVDGKPYLEFVRELKPKFHVVYFDLALAYLGLAISVAGLASVGNLGWAGIVGAVLVGPWLVGFWMANLQLFGHEGSHYNLARSKGANEWISNYLVLVWVGLEVSSYRQIHLGHHRLLGTAEDPEPSYLSPLNLSFLFEIATGKYSINTIRRRGKTSRSNQLWLGLMLNGLVVLGFALAGFWWVSLSWILGVLVVFPMLASVRQILEHRPRPNQQGPLSRTFNVNPFSYFFGGAGFNRHVLHHWEPAVSYTRLGDLERALMESTLKPILMDRKSTYFSELRALWGQ